MGPSSLGLQHDQIYLTFGIRGFLEAGMIYPIYGSPMGCVWVLQLFEERSWSDGKAGP